MRVAMRVARISSKNPLKSGLSCSIFEVERWTSTRGPLFSSGGQRSLPISVRRPSMAPDLPPIGFAGRPVSCLSTTVTVFLGRSDARCQGEPSPRWESAGWGWWRRSITLETKNIRSREAPALRTVADRLLSVACTLLEHQTLFDPAYKAAGRRRVRRQLSSLCLIENDHPFVPTCPLAERRAQRQSRIPARMRRHRRSRREACLTERARRYPRPSGTTDTSPHLRGYRPALFA